MTLTDAIAAIYEQLAAPSWAATNLDALADVLRDLSWLPEGPVRVSVPDLPEPMSGALRRVLEQVARETSAGSRPVILST